MDAAVITAIFSGLSTLIAAIAAAFVLVANFRLKTLSTDMGRLEENTNHKMDLLLAAKEKASRAEGVVAGRMEEREEVADRAAAAEAKEEDAQ